MKIQTFLLNQTFGLAMTLTALLFGISAQAKPCPSSAANPSFLSTVATQPTPAKTIVEIAAGNSAFTTLVQAVQAAGLVDTLSGTGPFTVFAPTNEAFAALPPGTLEKLLKPENRETLKKVLTYHVVPGDLMAKDLRSGRIATVEGSPVSIQVRNKTVTVNNATVTSADIEAGNGVIHVIDRVILPPNL